MLVLLWPLFPFLIITCAVFLLIPQSSCALSNSHIGRKVLAKTAGAYFTQVVMISL